MSKKIKKILFNGEEYPPETFRLGMMLCMVGGFMDAYTFVTRGKVLANAQTGNVVYLAINLQRGDFGKALLFFLVARVVAVVGTYLNILLTGQSTTSNDNALQSLGKIMSVNHIFFALLYVVTVAIIAPVIEELVFRGFATIFFFEKDQKISAAIIISIIFALPHISKWTEFPLYFAMGLVLYAAFARRGNLKDSIAVHILNNTPAALVMLFAMFR